MVKKRSSFAQHGPYLAIVAVVAVVAIVFLILNFAGISSTGEAVRVARTASAPDPCREGERCGFVTKDEVTKLVAGTGQKVVYVNAVVGVDYTTGKVLISEFYNAKSNAKSWQETTGNEICTKMGYKSCLVSEALDTTYYLSSSDGSCNGNIQLASRGYSMIPCDWPGFPWPGLQQPTCESEVLSGTAEPQSGDIATVGRRITGVICIE